MKFLHKLRARYSLLTSAEKATLSQAVTLKNIGVYVIALGLFVLVGGNLSDIFWLTIVGIFIEVVGAAIVGMGFSMEKKAK